MRLFVYGTLKKGFGLNESTLGSDDSCRYIGEGTIEGYDMYSNGYYPYIVPVKDDTKVHRIHGEIWEVNDSVMMTTLRSIEREYEETPVTVTTDLGVEECIAYVYMNDIRQSWTKIDDGVFKKHGR